jgi:PAS domain S-box-containing protein
MIKFEKNIFSNKALPLLGFLGFVIAFSLGGTWFYNQQKAVLENNFHHHLESQANFLETVAYHSLLKGDYHAIISSIENFGTGNAEIAEVSLRTSNNYMLSMYKRSTPAIKPLHFERKISYSFDKTAVLSLTGDLGSITDPLTELKIQVVTTGILLAIFFGFLVFHGMRRKIEAAILFDRTEELKNTNQLLHQEITEREQAEKKVIRAHDELNQIFDAAIDSIRIVDKNFNHVKVNSAFVRMTGLSETAIIEKKCYEVFPGPRCDTENCPLSRIKNGAELLEYETEKKLPDGRLMPFLVSAVCFRDTNGEMIGIVEDFKDISERKHAEEELRQAQKMEAIGTLAGGIAHDFNNILNAILGYTQLSLYEMPEDNPTYNNLQHVVKSAKRATELVKQILAFSRHSEHEKRPLEIQFVLKEALKLLRPTIPSTIQIKQEIDIKCRPVLADNTQIHQIIMNLCTNAYHAMREKGGVLTVSLDEYEITPEIAPHIDIAPGLYARLSIIDTGHGIEENTIKRIFEPYFTTKNRREGTGLGLAMVHGIVTAHMGAIKVQSTPGKGSNFTVFLPLLTDMQDFISQESSVAPALPTLCGNILLVDDEDTIVQLGKKILETLGCKVTAFTSSNAAWEAFRKEPENYDAVITDQTMPEFTGLELSKKILGIRPDIPIILATGYSETVNEEQAKKAGITKYIMKPLAITELAKAAESVLG